MNFNCVTSLRNEYSVERSTNDILEIWRHCTSHFYFNILYFTKDVRSNDFVENSEKNIGRFDREHIFTWGQLALRTMLCVPLQLIAPLTTALQRPVRRVGDFKSILGLDVKSQITAEIQRSWAQVVSLPTSATRSLPKMPVFYSLLVNNRRCRQLSR